MNNSHWSNSIAEVTVAARLPDRYLNLAIYGCSDNGQFCLVSPRINHNRISYRDLKLNPHDIILEIQGYKVSGYTQSDLEELIQSLTANCEPVLIKTVSKSFLPATLKEYLSESFTPNSLDQDLQRVIRDNVYLRVVPCTTRKPRPGEVNGFDYQFLSIEEFLELDKNDGLLESGMFDGNYYGTPKPNNRYQSMTNAIATDENRSLQSSAADLDEWELGPLPEHWEMAYTEDGFRYYIDHNSGTTQWNDPRLPEEISEDQYPNLEELQLDEALPYGWEKVYDPKYGVFYIDHNNKRTQYEPPDPNQIFSASVNADQAVATNKSNKLPSSNMAVSNLQFTSDPAKLVGSLVRTTLIKSPRGFGFTIIGGSDRSRPEFLQIKHVMPGGPAAVDGRLETGDVLVYVDHTLVLGFLHADIVDLFQCISIGQQVTLTVCKGYPLPFDIHDPRAHVVTTMAVNNIAINGIDPLSDLPNSSVTPEGSLSSIKSSLSAGGSNTEITSSANAKFFAKNPQPEFIMINIVKSSTGFGFTISDNPRGQRVKQILDPTRCGRLKEGDILVEINKVRVKERSHQEVVQILKECPERSEVAFFVQRGGTSAQGSNSSGYSSTGRMQPLPVSTPAPPLLPPKLSNTPISTLNTGSISSPVTYHTTTPATILSQSLLESRDTLDKRGLSDMAVAKYLSQQSPGNSNQLAGSTSQKNRSRTPGPDTSNRKSFLRDADLKNHDLYYNEPSVDDYSSIPRRPKTPTAAEMRTSCFWDPESGQTPNFVPASVLLSKPMINNGEVGQPSDLQDGGIPIYGSLSRPQKVRNLMPSNNKITTLYDSDNVPQVFFITLHKQSNGFGFRIIGGAEDNTKISIGPLVPDGAAVRSGIIKEGDELVSVNGAGVVGATHKKVVQLVEAAARLGSVTLGLRRPTKNTLNTQRRTPFDVTLARSENEGFGFVIVTSMTRSGSHVGEFIGKLIDNSPAQRCGLLRVGDRILSVNGSSVSRMRHEKIVHTIKNCGRTVTLRISPVTAECGHSGQTSITSYESSDQGSSHRSSSTSYQKSDVVGSTDVDFDVTLIRASKGFGFSIRGGQDFNKMPLYVLRIADDGPAKQDGRLKVGDKILQINGKITNGMTHSQAISIIQAGGKSIKLLVRRSANASQLLPKHESLTSSVHSKSSNISNNYSPNKRPVVPPNYDGHGMTTIVTIYINNNNNSNYYNDNYNYI